MEINQERRGSAIVLRLTGSFGESAAPFEEVLLSLVRDQGADIIIDLTGADDFRALRTITAAEQLRRNNGAMHRLGIVTAPGSAPADRLIFSGMGKLVPIHGTIEDLQGAWETDGFPA